MEGRVSMSGDGRSSSNLTVYNLTAGDSGVYFCAARHCGVRWRSLPTKTCCVARDDKEELLPQIIPLLPGMMVSSIYYETRWYLPITTGLDGIFQLLRD